MIRILFVCLGNICRSPMAEGIFIKLVKDHGLEKEFIIDSAGTSNYHIGELADPRMREKAGEYGIDLIHLGRQFSTDDFSSFDYILAMDRSNYQNILRVRENRITHKNILLLRDFDPVKKSEDVPDPYYGGAEGFEEVYQILLRSCQQLLHFIIEKHFPDHGKNS